MTLSQQTKTSNSTVCYLEDDLSTLACHAAIELEHLIHDREFPFKLSALEQLIEALSEEIPSESDCNSSDSFIDPTTIRVMNHAMIQYGNDKLTTVKQLFDEARKITLSLREIIDLDRKGEKDSEKAENMKKFCLELSKSSAAYGPSSYRQRRKHPFQD